ncbi:hypothetical protein LSH36_255g02040 [Paralvinella palmiformis]|uniref:Uncharacterized protein n=1 Tax=Paralvinella palmiformis TaxID=53620 RepID=A0AAD9N5B7_9ANNE|nr:hypothetical protein LSH36_255g02040 [Paralvinella palmiformis]
MTICQTNVPLIYGSLNRSTCSEAQVFQAHTLFARPVIQWCDNHMHMIRYTNYNVYQFSVSEKICTTLYMNTGIYRSVQNGILISLLITQTMMMMVSQSRMACHMYTMYTQNTIMKDEVSMQPQLSVTRK